MSSEPELYSGAGEPVARPAAAPPGAPRPRSAATSNASARSSALGRGAARPGHRADRLAPPGPRAPPRADRRRRRRRLRGRRPDDAAPRPPPLAVSRASSGRSGRRRRRAGRGRRGRRSPAPISETKTGSQPKISRHVVDQRAGGLGVLDVLDDPGVGAVVVALARVVDAAARSSAPRVRTRSTGVISSSRVRIGLIFSAEPIQARAPPIRPPRRRYSRVSIANHIFSSSRASLGAPRARPRRPAPAAAAAGRGQHAEAHGRRQPVRQSKTWIRSPPLPSSISRWRACTAASKVPEIPAEMWIETMSRPSSSSGS